MRVNFRNHIVIDPEICHGQPCLKGTRIIVYLVLELLETGIAFDEIIRDYYPELTREAIQAAICYAAELTKTGNAVPFSEGLDAVLS